MGEMKIHSNGAWGISSQYSYALASDTRTLAAQIDEYVAAMVVAEREACADAAENCETPGNWEGWSKVNAHQDAVNIAAAAIRARATQKEGK